MTWIRSIRVTRSSDSDSSGLTCLTRRRGAQAAAQRSVLRGDGGGVGAATARRRARVGPRLRVRQARRADTPASVCELLRAGPTRRPGVTRMPACGLGCGWGGVWRVNAGPRDESVRQQCTGEGRQPMHWRRPSASALEKAVRQCSGEGHHARGLVTRVSRAHAGMRLGAGPEPVTKRSRSGSCRVSFTTHDAVSSREGHHARGLAGMRFRAGKRPVTRAWGVGNL